MDIPLNAAAIRADIAESYGDDDREVFERVTDDQIEDALRTVAQASDDLWNAVHAVRRDAIDRLFSTHGYRTITAVTGARKLEDGSVVIKLTTGAGDVVATCNDWGSWLEVTYMRADTGSAILHWEDTSDLDDALWPVYAAIDRGETEELALSFFDNDEQED